MRIKFRDGEQRKFLDLVITSTNAFSLRSLLQFGLETNYSSLKNYYNESRTLPKFLFDELIVLSKIDPKTLSFEELSDYWGMIKGGKKSKRK